METQTVWLGGGRFELYKNDDKAFPFKVYDKTYNEWSDCRSIDQANSIKQFRESEIGDSLGV
jgi:protein tyrosine phosphatase